MRFIAVILIAYVSLVMVSSTICQTYTLVNQADLRCGSANTKQCSKDKTNKKQSANNTSCTPCCSIQNCHCNFVEVPEFNFLINSSKVSKKAPIKNDKVISNYLSDCWHPPKIV